MADGGDKPPTQPRKPVPLLNETRTGGEGILAFRVRTPKHFRDFLCYSKYQAGITGRRLIDGGEEEGSVH
jgi:hypothetical protein